MTRYSTPLSRAARTALAVSTSTTASWNDAATSATGTVSPAFVRASTHRATAVFNPEKENANGSSRGPVMPRGKAIAAELPDEASRSIGGPPGNGKPNSRATLS